MLFLWLPSLCRFFFLGTPGSICFLGKTSGTILRILFFLRKTDSTTFVKLTEETGVAIIGTFFKLKNTGASILVQ